MNANQKSLNDVMQFDHVVTINNDGSISEGPDSIYAPELWEGELLSDEWELLSGFSSQSGGKNGRYLGPIMHDSEYIGGGLEDYILDNPGIYVSIVSNYADENGWGDESSGWAVARYRTQPKAS